MSQAEQFPADEDEFEDSLNKKRGSARRRRRSDANKRLVIDAVVNEKKTCREAANAVWPRMSVSTVYHIVKAFLNESGALAKLPEVRIGRAERRTLLTDVQIDAVVNMVSTNANLKVKALQEAIIRDNGVFADITSISTATISRILEKNIRFINTHQAAVYDCNSEAVKAKRLQFVKEIVEVEQGARKKFIYLDESGFNTSGMEDQRYTQLRERATRNSGIMRGGNISLFAALSEDGLLLFQVQFSPYTAIELERILDDLAVALRQSYHPNDCVLLLDDAPLHRSEQIKDWLTKSGYRYLLLPQCSPFLNAVEHCFCRITTSSTLNNDAHISLFESLQAAARAISFPECRSWIEFAKGFYPSCLQQEDIAVVLNKDIANDDHGETDLQST